MSFNVYTDDKLAAEIDDLTVEGTEVFLWADCCYSSRWSDLKQSSHHNNHLISYVYTREAYVNFKADFNEFFYQIWSYNQKVETIFSYVRTEFINNPGVHEDDGMEKWDYLSGYFYI